jgi:hypothetical protein
MAAAVKTMVELEVDEQHNGNLNFFPLGRTLRGRFDLSRAAKHDRDASALFTQWPEPIPGQRLKVNFAENKATLIEPLREPDNADLLAEIEKSALVEPHKQDFENIDAATWSFWLGRAVEGGLVRVVAGQLPTERPAGKPQVSFYVKREADQAETAIDRLAVAVERQGDMLAQLITKLTEK